ncbi:EF-hand domain-containing protein [Sulfitobacter sp. D35]|uniref:EF-hand domain-containing protein n=1 Tax=Sulfitobacter sp. D35 TaxID=3083252 RepID=UPI00296E9347|nr:EF-hand domain-containing protein [Sulfitobacter sp. D35]MDW4496621.1 EF-hand domain-containing protein [Sulfitobacter sp. D35]
MKLSTLLAAGLAATLAVTAQSAVASEGRGHFRQLDADGDGKVTRGEMQARGKARMQDADTDNDGFLTRDEMIAAASARATGMVDAMLKRVDTDGDGRLSEAELLAGAEARGGFDRLDADGDGAITRQEFREARKKMRGHRSGRGPGENQGD